jgi:IS30 family transposase
VGPGNGEARHNEIADLLADGVFFAYPGRPWQRASNENANGLLRQYFPKRGDLAIYTPADLAAVEERLNNRPRKTLGWKTPAQVFAVALRS